MDTHSVRHLPCSLCSCHDWFAQWRDTGSMTLGGSTGPPAGHCSDSSRTAKGTARTTDPRSGDTLDRDKRGPSLGPCLRSPWGSSSIFVPAWDRRVQVKRWFRENSTQSHFYFPLSFFINALQAHVQVLQERAPTAFKLLLWSQQFSMLSVITCHFNWDTHTKSRTSKRHRLLLGATTLWIHKSQWEQIHTHTHTPVTC